MTGSKTDVDESNRMWASAAFVGVLIVVGVPLWWKTTEVYRVSLPYSEIGAFDTRSNVVATELTILAEDEQVASKMAASIQDAFKNTDILKLKINKGLLSEQLRHAVDTLADDAEALEVVSETLDLSKRNHIYVVQRKPLTQDVWVSTERVVFFRNEKAIKTLTSVLSTCIYQPSVLSGARAARVSDSARRVRFPPAAAFRLVFTVAHPKPQSLDVVFDAATVVDDYIGSFVDELTVLHNFTLKSQWLHLLDFDFQARKAVLSSPDPEGWSHHNLVQESRLHLLLTRVEQRAATLVSELPTINLMMYVIPCDEAPLRIVGDDGTLSTSPVQAFLSPKWGGVFLASPPHSVCNTEGQKTWKPNERIVMGTLIAQLRQLLGITDAEPITNAHIEPLRSVLPRQWEVDNLLRIRTLEQLTSAQLTLQSLAQLLEEISNIVINDEVGASINKAVEYIKRSHEALISGQLEAAHSLSQTAFLEAESAFTDPSLLALLYFPDDQKYAIYIPLFLPVLFPVVLSLKKLFRWFKGGLVTKVKTE